MRFILRLLTITLTVVLLTMLSVLALSRPPGTPTQAGWLAFVSRSLRGADDTAITRILPDGANPRPLITGLPRAEYLTWSAASARLAFVSGGLHTAEIVQLRANGANLEPVAAIERGHIPSWSPDGQRLLFGDATSLVQAVPGLPSQRLALAPPDGFMSWAPDGRSLVYGVDGVLMRADLESTSLTPLTDDTRRDFFPAWSPGGDWLAYISDTATEAAIFRVRPDGSERQRLLSGLYLMGYPAWSPDGRSLAFVSYHVTRSGVYVMDVARGTVRSLPGSVYPYWFPTWSPDGRWLYVAIQSNAQYDIYRIRTDGEAVQPVTNLPTDDVYPVWMSHPAQPIGWLPLALVGLALAGSTALPRQMRSEQRRTAPGRRK